MSKLCNVNSNVAFRHTHTQPYILRAVIAFARWLQSQCRYKRPCLAGGLGHVSYCSNNGASASHLLLKQACNQKPPCSWDGMRAKGIVEGLSSCNLLLSPDTANYCQLLPTITKYYQLQQTATNSYKVVPAIHGWQIIRITTNRY